MIKDSLSTDLTMGDAFGHFIIWGLLSFTIVGLFFWPYAFVKLILGSMIINGRRVECNLPLGSQIGHIAQWMLICLITFGLAFPFYVFGVFRTAINKSALR